MLIRLQKSNIMSLIVFMGKKALFQRLSLPNHADSAGYSSCWNKKQRMFRKAISHLSVWK